MIKTNKRQKKKQYKKLHGGNPPKIKEDKQQKERKYPPGSAGAAVSELAKYICDVFSKAALLASVTCLNISETLADYAEKAEREAQYIKGQEVGFSPILEIFEIPAVTIFPTENGLEVTVEALTEKRLQGSRRKRNHTRYNNRRKNKW